MVQEHDPSNNPSGVPDAENVEVDKPAPTEFVLNKFATKLQDIGTSGQPKLRFSLNNLPPRVSTSEQA